MCAILLSYIFSNERYRLYVQSNQWTIKWNLLFYKMLWFSTSFKSPVSIDRSHVSITLIHRTLHLRFINKSDPIFIDQNRQGKSSKRTCSGMENVFFWKTKQHNFKIHNSAHQSDSIQFDVPHTVPFCVDNGQSWRYFFKVVRSPNYNPNSIWSMVYFVFIVLYFLYC